MTNQVVIRIDAYIAEQTHRRSTGKTAPQIEMRIQPRGAKSKAPLRFSRQKRADSNWLLAQEIDKAYRRLAHARRLRESGEKILAAALARREAEHPNGLKPQGMQRG